MRLQVAVISIIFVVIAVLLHQSWVLLVNRKNEDNVSYKLAIETVLGQQTFTGMIFSFITHKLGSLVFTERIFKDQKELVLDAEDIRIISFQCSVNNEWKTKVIKYLLFLSVFDFTNPH